MKIKKNKDQDKDKMDEKRYTRSLVITGFVLLIFSFLLNWEFIYSEPVVDRLLGLIGISAGAGENSGLHYTTAVSIVLLMLGLISLHQRYSGKMLIVFFVVFMLLPNDLFANVYQSIFAKGIYALEYNQDKSSCQYHSINSKNLVVKCTLSFVNHSNKSLSFHVSNGPGFDIQGFHVMKKMNLKERQLEIGPHEQKTFEMNFQGPIKLKDTEHINGGIDVSDIKIIGKEHTRKL